MRIGTVLILLMIASSWQSVHAQESVSETTDESEIRKIGAAYVEAFNAKNADKVASFWSPEAVYVNRSNGDRVTGREAIAAQFKGLFTPENKLKLDVSVDSIQFVSPNVAAENGTATYVGPDGTPEQVEYQAVYVRREGKWLLDRVTDTPLPESASNYEYLKDLSWLIGTWEDNDDAIQVNTECSWTKNKNFITRTFTVSGDGIDDLSGIQIIGFDAASKQIRSWTFDSDGGFAQGVWTDAHGDWYVQKKGTTVQGKKTSAINRISVIDDDSFTLQSTQRIHDGAILPNVDEVLVQRKQ